jgi:endonuclease/exonuclease/phosphatase family metal-dependent hydrolase
MASATLDFRYDLERERRALARRRKDGPLGAIPARQQGRLLIASWNIARLGANERRDEDYELLATMLGWFELVAIQEVRDNLAGLRALQERLPKHFRVLFSDTAGNNERMAFLYDGRKVQPLEEIGEIGFSPRELARVRKDPVGAKFDSFDRTPHLAAFEAEQARFLLANVHLYFGGGSAIGVRAAEAFAVAAWAQRRHGDRHAYTRNVLAVGDFNLPKVDPDDRIYKALTAKGLMLPKDAATRVGTNLGGTKQYDQVVFLPQAGSSLAESGVFDFDEALFQQLEPRKRLPVLRYRVSDHRILWFALPTNGAPRARGRAAAGALARPGAWMRGEGV